MQNINQIRATSIWIFILPIVVLNLCLFISVNGHLLQGTIFQVDAIGRSSFTIPYIDGGTSISRSSRTYPAYLLFKPGMIITGILLIKYWLAYNRLVNEVYVQIKNNHFIFFGIGSAIFLILHSIFLGIHFDNSLYKLFRRVVILLFIIFEIVAQGYLVFNLYKIKEKISKLINIKILKLKRFLVTLLVVVAIASIPIISMPGNKFFKHALEWDFFLGVITFYLLTFFLWKKK